MKKILAVVLASVMVLSLAACAAPAAPAAEAAAPAAEAAAPAAEEAAPAAEAAAPAAEEAAPAKGGSYTIAVVGKQEASEWWQVFIEGALKAGEDLGQNVFYRSPEKETDIEDQVSICHDCITQGIDALVLSAADPTALNDVIKECNDKGIPVVLVNDTVDDEALKSIGGEYVTYVGISQYNAAKLAGDYVGENVEPCPYAIVEGVPGVQAHTDRMNGFKDVADAKGFTLKASQTANCDMNEAYDVASNMLTANPDIKVFWTTNADMGTGIVSAIENMGLTAGKDGIMVFDFDCNSDDIAGLKKGTLMGSIDQNQAGMSYAAVEVAVKAIEGEDFGGVGSHYETAAVLVTPDTVK